MQQLIKTLHAGRLEMLL